MTRIMITYYGARRRQLFLLMFIVHIAFAIGIWHVLDVCMRKDIRLWGEDFIEENLPKVWRVLSKTDIGRRLLDPARSLVGEDPNGFMNKLFVVSVDSVPDVKNKIKVTLKIVSKEAGELVLTKERERALIISMGPPEKLLRSERPFELDELIDTRKRNQAEDTLERQFISLNASFEYTIEGTIRRDEKSGHVIFDFGSFGVFTMKPHASYDIKAQWIPPIPFSGSLYDEYQAETTIYLKQRTVTKGQNNA